MLRSPRAGYSTANHIKRRRSIVRNIDVLSKLAAANAAERSAGLRKSAEFSSMDDLLQYGRSVASNLGSRLGSIRGQDITSALGRGASQIASTVAEYPWAASSGRGLSALNALQRGTSRVGAAPGREGIYDYLLSVMGRKSTNATAARRAEDNIKAAAGKY